MSLCHWRKICTRLDFLLLLLIYSSVEWLWTTPCENLNKYSSFQNFHFPYKHSILLLSVICIESDKKKKKMQYCFKSIFIPDQTAFMHQWLSHQPRADIISYVDQRMEFQFFFLVCLKIIENIIWNHFLSNFYHQVFCCFRCGLWSFERRK